MGKDNRVVVSLDDKDYEILVKLCVDLDMSMSDVIRHGIRQLATEG